MMQANRLTQRARKISGGRSDRQDVNLSSEMLKPIGHHSDAETPDLKRATSRILDDEFAFEEGILRQLVEDTKQRLTLFLGGKTEPFQHRRIDGVCVGWNYLPSEDRRSCVSLRTAAEYPCPARDRSKRRPNSACHSGSFFSVCQLRYAARSSRSSAVNSSIARFNSATLMLDTICYRFYPVNLNVCRVRVPR